MWYRNLVSQYHSYRDLWPWGPNVGNSREYFKRSVRTCLTNRPTSLPVPSNVLREVCELLKALNLGADHSLFTVSVLPCLFSGNHSSPAEVVRWGTCLNALLNYTFSFILVEMPQWTGNFVLRYGVSMHILKISIKKIPKVSDIDALWWKPILAPRRHHISEPLIIHNWLICFLFEDVKISYVFLHITQILFANMCSRWQQLRLFMLKSFANETNETVNIKLNL